MDLANAYRFLYQSFAKCRVDSTPNADFSTNLSPNVESSRLSVQISLPISTLNADFPTNLSTNVESARLSTGIYQDHPQLVAEGACTQGHPRLFAWGALGTQLDISTDPGYSPKSLWHDPLVTTHIYIGWSYYKGT